MQLSAVKTEAPTSPERFSRRWGLLPDGKISTGFSRISAAIWGGGPAEIAADADPCTLTLSFALAAYSCDVFKDGRHIHTNRYLKTRPQLMTAGVAPRAVFLEPWRVIHIYMPRDLISEAAEEVNCRREPELRDPLGKPDPRLWDLGRQVVSLIESGARQSKLEADALGALLAVHLVRAWSDAGKLETPHAGGLAAWQARRIREKLRDQLGEELSLRELAKDLGLSGAHFARAFKAGTGLPPHRYLIQLRIEKAKELLEHTALPITEIAAKVGYDDPSYFGRLFAKEVGVPPSRYRRERQT